jgi:hypothetical protein
MYRFSIRKLQLASDLAISAGFLGNALRDKHRQQEALACTQESSHVLEAIHQPTPLDGYKLASAYSLLSTLTEDGTTTPSIEREALARRAMDVLRRSLASGMTFAAIERDHDLDPLRDRRLPRALARSRFPVPAVYQNPDRLMPGRAWRSLPSAAVGTLETA